MLITFSISMYIMCVILCLFRALSRRVSTLQISIIIIILALSLVNKFNSKNKTNKKKPVTSNCETQSKP